jgi:hypothetical protein
MSWHLFSILIGCLVWVGGPALATGQAIVEVGQAADTIEQLSADWSQARKLYPGIEHQRWELSDPRPLVVNCLRIDPKTPGLKFHSTGRIEGWENGAIETRRQTVRDYLRSERKKGVPLVVGINADAFTLKTAYNREDPCDLLGLAVAGGTTVSSPTGSPSLIVSETGALRIESLSKESSLEGIEVAVSGFGLCLRDGKPLPSGEDLHPRTGFGLSEQGDYLFLMTIDGRQPASWGATTAELGAILAEVGAFIAINMDGGGSTTLAWWNPRRSEADACELLNRPVGNGQAWSPGNEPLLFRTTERTNGNNFGISVRE